MAKKGVTGSNSLSADDREARRATGKETADRLRAECAAQGHPLDWFDACYREAHGDAALVPWGHEIVRAELSDWLAQLAPDAPRGRALDVGCGLGDNAAALARAGFTVTAFDISSTATQWAHRRFPDAGIEWAAHNLLNPVPSEWRAAFDLVNETYTLQALTGEMRRTALRHLTEFVKPGGLLLIICRAIIGDEQASPPPWPLRREELDIVREQGLIELRFENIEPAPPERKVRHFRVLYQKPA